jgi:hypothetical protein
LAADAAGNHTASSSMAATSSARLESIDPRSSPRNKKV